MIVQLSRRSELAFIGLFCLVFSILWNYYAGQDLNWDSINYHFYAGFSLFNDRLDQDFFPAGEQSYFNPLVYSLFYWMVVQDWQSVWVASVLAAIHSLNFYLLYLIVGELVGWEGHYRRDRFLAWFLGLLSAAVWMFVGSSFADLIVSIPQMLAVFYGIKSCRIGCFRIAIGYWGVAAMLLGMAAGLKFSGLMFCIVFALVTVWRGVSQRNWQGLRLICISGLLGLIGFSIVSGYWGWLMWEKFGNPFFPFLNGFFQSEYYLAESFSDRRFTVDGFFELLAFIFYLAIPKGWIYLEKIAPDLRFFLGALLALIFLVLHRFRLKKKNSQELLFKSFILVFWLAFSLWAFSSGNGRYAVPLMLLIGPIIVLASDYILSRPLRNIFLIVVLIVQGVTLSISADTRFSRSDWGKSWYDFNVPDAYLQKEYLFITGDTVSFSFLTKYVNNSSSFINIGGTLLPENEIVFKEIRSKSEDYTGRTKGLFSCGEETDEFIACIRLVSPKFERYGFSVDRHNCEWSNSVDKSKKIVGCDIHFSDKLILGYRKKREKVEKIFKAFDTVCGGLFQAGDSPIIKQGNTYGKLYPGDGVRLWLRENDDFFLQVVWGFEKTYLGKGEYWLFGDDLSKENLCNKIEKNRFHIRSRFL